MTAPDLREVLATADVVHDRATLEAAIERMAGEIAPEYANDARPPLYLTIMHGGLPFAASLAMELGTLGIDRSELTIGAPRRLRDPRHLKYVTTQGCLVCGRKPSDS